MQIQKRAARRAGIKHPPVAFGWLPRESSEDYLPRINLWTEGKGRKLVIKVGNLRGFEGPEDNAEYVYWIEMTISELAWVVSEVMKVAPSAEVLEAAARGAASALRRRVAKK